LKCVAKIEACSQNYKQMKKIFLTIGVVAFMLFNVYAQDDARADLKFAIKGGVNLSNVYDTESEDYEASTKLGLVGGVFLAVPIGKYLGFHPEILFSQKGMRAEGTTFGIDYEYRRTSNFIDVPLLLAFKPTPLIAIVAGPQFSYLIKEKEEFTSGTFTEEQETAFENENLRKNTLAFLCGLDFNFNSITLGTRAGWDLVDNNGDGTTTDPRYKNVWYQFTLGFVF
jgi:hypothetical protein